MGDKTTISWTDATWNMIRAKNRKTGKQGWHCERVTAACTNCYAANMNMKPGASGGTGFDYKPGHRKDVHIFLAPEALLQPMRWRRGRMIFPCSMTDLGAEFVSDEWLDQIFAVMALTPRHTYQVLTKRPDRIRQYMLERWQGTPAHPEMDIPAGGETGRHHMIAAAAADILERLGLDDPDKGELWDDAGRLKALQFGWPLPNVWIGTSICDQENAEDFLPHLLGTPAALHFVSAAPLLGPINLKRIAHTPRPGVAGYANVLTGWWSGEDVGEGCGWAFKNTIRWVLTEGESGKEARPSHPDWFRQLRDDCASARVSFHHKQNGEWAPVDPSYPDAGLIGIDPEIGEHDCAFDFSRAEHMARIGLKKAGRLLDGVEHNGFPT